MSKDSFGFVSKIWDQREGVSFLPSDLPGASLPTPIYLTDSRSGIVTITVTEIRHKLNKGIHNWTGEFHFLNFGYGLCIISNSY